MSFLDDIVHGIEGFVNTIEQFNPIHLVEEGVADVMHDVGVPDQITNAFKIGAGALTCDVGEVCEGVAGEAASLQSAGAAQTEYPVQDTDASWSPPGYAGPSTQTVDLSGDTYLNWHPTDPAAASAVAQAKGMPFRFDAETAGAKLKELIESNPNVREAFQRDFGCQVIPGGAGGSDDLQVAWNQPPPPPLTVVPRSPQCGGGPIDCGGDGDDDDLTSIINAPGVSMEAKIMAILEKAQDRINAKLDGVMQQYQQATQTDQGKGGGQCSPKTQSLQIQLQELMQQREQMFSTMSNVSKDFHDMAMTAINNMKG